MKWHLWLSVPVIAVSAFVVGSFSLVGLWPAFVSAGCTSVLCYLSITDLKVNRIPNNVVLPALIPSVATYHLGPFGTEASFWTDIGLSLVGGTAAAAVACGIYVLSRRRFGGGDVKLIGLIGTMLSIQYLPLALILGISAAGITSIFLLVTKRARLNDTVPLAPFLSAPTIVILMFANHIPTFGEALERLYY